MVLSGVTLSETRLTEGYEVMNSPTTFRTPYEKRVELVKQTLMASSTLDDDLAGKLAVEVLKALNSISETIR